MPPSPIPAPLPLWAKALLQIAPFAAGYLYDLLTNAGDATPAQLKWARCEAVFTRLTPAGTQEDMATMNLNVMNITGGLPDPTWSAGDLTDLTNALTTFTSSLATNMVDNHTLKEWRIYLRAFNDYDNAKPFASSGPPVTVLGQNAIGQVTKASGALPYQVAASVTLLTAFPRHWGRFYMPGVPQPQIDDYGRLESAYRTALNSATATLATTLQTHDLHLVVPVTQVDKQPARGLLVVHGLQVDDIPDVQRRRRPKSAAARTQTSP